MASANSSASGSGLLDGRVAVAAYQRWLGRQPLATRTREAYLI